MTLAFSPNAFKRRVAVAIDRALVGNKRTAGYAAMADGIGSRYEIRLVRGTEVRAVYTMSGTIPYTLTTGLAPTAAQIASVAQSAAIDLSSGSWTVEIASTVNATWKITGTLATSGGDFSLGGVAPPPAPAPADVGPVGQNAALWSRTFTEEFDNATLDGTKWNTAIWYGDDNGANAVTNYDVHASSNSCLRIWPALGTNGAFFNRTIDTDGKFSQQYGFFEARIKLLKGRGVFPAFWLFNHPGSLRPEIDIMEAYGGSPSDGWATSEHEPNNYGASLHLPGVLTSQGPFKLSDFLGAQRLDTDFHVYGCEWDATTVKFFFDGQLLTQRSFALPYPLYILLDLWWYNALDPDETGARTPLGSSNSMSVDYVRAWRRA